MEQHSPLAASRSTSSRVGLVVSVLVGFGLSGYLIDAVVALALNPSNYADIAAYAAAVRTAVLGVSGALVLLAVAAFSRLCPKVSYRGRDALFLLVPVHNLVFAVRILWRLAGLPHRDWPPTPAELAAELTGQAPESLTV